MGIGQALANAVRQLHESGGRAVGSPRVPGDVQEFVTISAVLFDRDCARVAVKRLGQTTATGYIPWAGSIAPVVNARGVLFKPGGSMNLGWVQPKTVAPA